MSATHTELRSGAAQGLPPRRSRSNGPPLEVGADRGDRLLWMAHVRAVAGGPELVQCAPRKMALKVIPDRLGGDRVLTALQDERRHPHVREIRAIVGEERRFSETSRDDGIGRTEA